MKVLVIGGSGNISSATVERLLARRDEVWILTRGKRPVAAGARPLVADRGSRDSMAAALGGLEFDAAVNFLGYTVPDVKTDFELLSGRVSQYIFISSATVYAKPHRELPIRETSRLGNPFSQYARDKEQCEAWLMARHVKSGFPVTIVRPSHTYSNRWIPNPVTSAGYTFAARLERGEPVFIHDGGRTPWAITAASDFAAGLAGLTGLKDAIGEAYHITTDEHLTWSQIYSETVAAVGAMHPRIVSMPTDFICNVEPDMVARLKGDKAEPGVFDNSKIKAAVPGFRCNTLFRDGIRESVRWFREDPARQSVDPAVSAVFDRLLAAWGRRQGF